MNDKDQYKVEKIAANIADGKLNKFMETISNKIDQTIEKRAEHNQPSTQTLQFMSEFKIKIENIEQKINSMPTRDEMKLDIADAIQKAMDKCDEKYAGKLTEKIVFGVVVILCLGAIGVIGYLIKSHLGIN